ncbi:MAG: glycosyltransferase [Acidimicrobiales bacterium]
MSSEDVGTHLVCAIITPNYLDQFLVLGRSLARHMPDVEVRVLVLQDCVDVTAIQAALDGYRDGGAVQGRHVALTIDDVDWGDFDVESAVQFYDILEFATSVKPALMRSLLREGWDRVTYLDPDIEVYADFTSLLDDSSDLSLTPHFLSDIPRDDHRPSTYDVLMAGFFNLGFASARPGAMPFLDWWSARLQFECLNDHRRGRFTDQKIVDMATLMTRVQVVADPGVNVAYWNLHERKVIADGDGWAVDVAGVTSPLYFFHFSGFVLDQSATLSRHSSRHVVGDAMPRALAVGYDERLRSGDGSPYEFTLGGAPLAEGIPDAWHRAIREDAEAHAHAGWSLPDVRERLYPSNDPARWAICRSCGESHDNFGARATSFLVGWATHASLSGAPNGVSAMYRGEHFEYREGALAQLAWAATGLARELAGVPDVAAEVLRAARAAVRDAADLKLVGYFSCPTGLGQIARWTLKTLEEEGLRVSVERVYALGDSFEYLSALLARPNPLAAADSSALCFINADQWGEHVVGPGRVNTLTQQIEAVWAWELDHVPATMFDAARGGPSRVHALSRWSAHALGRVLPVPVQRFAPFDGDLVDALEVREVTGSPVIERPYLLTTFDSKSYLARKNPEGVLELWRRVAEDFPDHRLVIKSSDFREVAPPSLLDAVDESPRTILIDRHLSDADYAELLAHCAAFVSLHRSEGMGLTPIEAGLRGLPVIYTNYGGVAEYLQDGFFPVAYSPARVGDAPHDAGPYDADAWWAEPDMDDAERQLRRALTLTTDDASEVSLRVDRKQLIENLLAARAEVVVTAERLIEAARVHEDTPTALMELFDRALSNAPEEPALPDPNRMVLVVLAVAWRVYKILPRALRRQFNIALFKLRREHGDL